MPRRNLSRYVGRLPDRLVLPLAIRLAARPARGPLTEKNRDLLAGFSRSVISGRPHLVAYERGRGPVVLFVHGWGGRGAHLALLASAAAERGFRAVLFDAAGHGESGGNRIGFDCFAQSAARAAKSIGLSIHCIVGHSAGGLSVMAKSAAPQLQAKGYVCIAAPLYPYVPLDRLREELGASENVLERCKPFYASQLDMTWEALREGAAYWPSPRARLSLVYDRDDKQVRSQDGTTIRQLWPGADLLVTTGLGHQRLLWDQQVIDHVVQFIESV